jgi:hypothetical protein
LERIGSRTNHSFTQMPRTRVDVMVTGMSRVAPLMFLFLEGGGRRQLGAGEQWWAYPRGTRHGLASVSDLRDGTLLTPGVQGCAEVADGQVDDSSGSFLGGICLE